MNRAYAAPSPEGPCERGDVPTFSVVIAAYQAAATILKAVESALAQTLRPMEVIVCDDGSTDDLERALEPYHERIVFLRKDHRGVAAARNHALRAAAGEFVALLDSDDVFLPRRLEALGELAAARPDLDLLCTDAYFELDDRIVGRFYDENRFAIREQRTAILDGCFVGWPAARREPLVRLGGFDESLTIASDWDAWMRLILAGARAGLVPEPLLRYRVRTGSLSSNRTHSLRARVVLLDKAANNPDLRPEDRRALGIARRRASARVGSAESLEALAERRPAARRRALRLALRRHVPAKIRIVMLAAAVAPDVAARLLARRSPRGSPAGRRPSAYGRDSRP